MKVYIVNNKADGKGRTDSILKSEDEAIARCDELNESLAEGDQAYYYTEVEVA